MNTVDGNGNGNGNGNYKGDVGEEGRGAELVCYLGG